MKIFIKVKPNAKIDKVEQQGDDSFEVIVKELPIQGRANRAVMELLADYFNTPKTSLKIVSGYTSRSKIIEID
ncbi:MAG: hypothetical protein ACD_68C00112G0002 [uncultured bacterium]|nr:MAG: hypothetical protein ACD_68C00112G0002 [uncultured bacterium]